MASSTASVSIDPRLTLLMLTHNRPAFLTRALRYYAEFPYQMLVLDSSPQPNEQIAHRYRDSHIQYHHCPTGSKAVYGLDLVQSPYMLFVCDDDFTLREGIEQSLDFLSAHCDYVACMGYTMLYLASASAVHYLTRDRAGVDAFDEDAPHLRIVKFFSNYRPACYAVCDTNVQRTWYHRIPADLNNDYGEFGQAFNLLSAGKLRMLPVAFALREFNYPIPEHQSDLYRTFSHPTHEGQPRESFYAMLEQILCTSIPNLPPALAREVIEKSTSALIASLEAGNTLTVEQAFSSVRKGIGEPIEWRYHAPQPSTTPFCHPETLQSLHEVDFLVRAMPCSKHQLKELAPMLQLHDQVVARAEYAWSIGESQVVVEAMEAVLSENPFHLRALCLLCDIAVHTGNGARAESLAAWAHRIDPLDARVRALQNLFGVAGQV